MRTQPSLEISELPPHEVALGHSSGSGQVCSGKSAQAPPPVCVLVSVSVSVSVSVLVELVEPVVELVFVLVSELLVVSEPDCESVEDDVDELLVVAVLCELLESLSSSLLLSQAGLTNNAVRKGTTCSQWIARFMDCKYA